MLAGLWQSLERRALRKNLMNLARRQLLRAHRLMREVRNVTEIEAEVGRRNINQLIAKLLDLLHFRLLRRSVDFINECAHCELVVELHDGLFLTNEAVVHIECRLLQERDRMRGRQISILRRLIIGRWHRHRLLFCEQ